MRSRREKTVKMSNVKMSNCQKVEFSKCQHVKISKFLNAQMSKCWLLNVQNQMTNVKYQNVKMHIRCSVYFLWKTIQRVVLQAKTATGLHFGAVTCYPCRAFFRLLPKYCHHNFHCFHHNHQSSDHHHHNYDLWALTICTLRAGEYLNENGLLVVSRY